MIRRNHDLKKSESATIKYLLYYERDTILSRDSRVINKTDPLFLFIFDTEGRLVKVLNREFGSEYHYFLIYDDSNKVEKVLVLEVGDFGLKRIQKIIAEK